MENATVLRSDFAVQGDCALQIPIGVILGWFVLLGFTVLFWTVLGLSVHAKLTSKAPHTKAIARVATATCMGWTSSESRTCSRAVPALQGSANNMGVAPTSPARESKK